MRLTSRPLLRAFTVLAASLLASAAQARMEPMEDSELAEVTGQANFNLTTDSHDGMNFTRLNFGLDVATQLNIKKLQLGLYDRTAQGEAADTADVNIDNFALGSVNDATGQINPFLIKNPFLELAYQGDKVVGMRLGFAEAKGHMSGDIKQITGNISVDIYGKGSYLAPRISCAWYDALCGIAKLAVGGTYADTDFKAQAQLIDGNGNADPVRGVQVGLLDGQTLAIPSGNSFDAFLLGLFKSSDCYLLGVKTCFPLTNYGSFPIGKFDSGSNTFGAPATGVFLSLQTKDLKWRDQQDPAKLITALAGAFMNLPRNADGSAAITTSFQEAFDGIPRVDTCLGSASAGC